MLRRWWATGAAALGLTLLALVGVGRVADVGVAHATDGTPTRVGALGCLLQGGHRMVPAGSRIVVTAGWITGPRGGLQAFLAAQVTLISVNDGPMRDLSDAYAPIEERADGHVQSLVRHDTGVTLAQPGDSMKFTVSLYLTRPLNDVFDLDGDGEPDPQRYVRGLQYGGTCTVTAV